MTSSFSSKRIRTETGAVAGSGLLRLHEGRCNDVQRPLGRCILNTSKRYITWMHGHEPSIRLLYGNTTQGFIRNYAVPRVKISLTLKVEMDSRQCEELLNALDSATPLSTEPKTKFSLVSWNIDGLNPEKIEERTMEVCKILSSEKIDIVFLQELIPPSIEYIEDTLSQYQVISGCMEDQRYFTGILLLRSTVYYESHRIIPHQTSCMKRNLLCVKAGIGEIKLELVNTHLESIKQNSEERTKQLHAAFSYIKSNSMDRTAIFAGDLNLRDYEAHVPQGVDDLWEVCGSKVNVQYTWDTKLNSNARKMISYRGFWPRLRFDRGYIRYSPKRDVVPQDFSLIGQKRIKGTGRRNNTYPSDHWGIKIVFVIKREEDSKEENGNGTSETPTSS